MPSLSLPLSQYFHMFTHLGAPQRYTFQFLLGFITQVQLIKSLVISD